MLRPFRRRLSSSPACVRGIIVASHYSRGILGNLSVARSRVDCVQSYMYAVCIAALQVAKDMLPKPPVPPHAISDSSLKEPNIVKHELQNSSTTNSSSVASDHDRHAANSTATAHTQLDVASQQQQQQHLLTSHNNSTAAAGAGNVKTEPIGSSSTVKGTQPVRQLLSRKRPRERESDSTAAAAAAGSTETEAAAKQQHVANSVAAGSRILDDVLNVNNSYSNTTSNSNDSSHANSTDTNTAAQSNSTAVGLTAAADASTLRQPRAAVGSLT